MFVLPVEAMLDERLSRSKALKRRLAESIIASLENSYTKD